MVDLVLGGLGEDVQKRPNSLHGLICPKLMMPVWVRLVLKMADLVVYGPPGGICCPSSMQKSFVVGFISPLIPHRP